MPASIPAAAASALPLNQIEFIAIAVIVGCLLLMMGLRERPSRPALIELRDRFSRPVPPQE